MSAEKREQLIAEGKLNPDGSRKVVCPTCGHEFAQGEEVPESLLAPPAGPDDAVAEAEAIAADAATGEAPQ